MDKGHSTKRGPALIKTGTRRTTGSKVKRSGTDNKVQPKITDIFKPKISPTPIQHKKVDLNSVKFKQLNNNRRETSMDEINRFCTSEPFFVCFGHEPNNKLGAPTGLNKHHTKIFSLTGRPRAYIFASSKLHIWPMPSLTNEDVVTALFDTHNPKVGKLLLCSFYWDILEKEIPELYWKAADFAKSNGYILVTGSDTNAHSTLWNCDKDNARGKKLEEMMIKSDLVPVNKGRK